MGKALLKRLAPLAATGKALLKRLALLAATLLLVSVLAFTAFSVIPGDPTQSVLGMEATEEQIATFRARHGLDLPPWERYGSWLAAFVKFRHFAAVIKYFIWVIVILPSPFSESKTTRFSRNHGCFSLVSGNEKT